MPEATYTVIDDSGFLAVLDPDAYETFVAEEWTFERLRAHFRRQMAERRLLIWCTGREAIWTVAIGPLPTGDAGFRAVSGPIVASRGRLLLTSLDSLSMAAQFADVALPESHEADQVLHLPARAYRCAIVQCRDPSPSATAVPVGGGPDFRLALEATGPIGPPPWDDIPWLEAWW